MKAHNFKYVDWKIKARYNCSNGEKGLDTTTGFGVVDTIGENPKKMLRLVKDHLEEGYNCVINQLDPEMQSKLISCKVKYIPFADARKRAEQHFAAGILEKEVADHFGLN